MRLTTLMVPLTSVIVDEDVGSTALQLVSGNGFLDRLNCRLDDAMQTLLVNWHLNGDMWQFSVCVAMEASWWFSRVELAVGLHERARPKDLSQVANDGLEEELEVSVNVDGSM
jgi:hypothetical protein